MSLQSPCSSGSFNLSPLSTKSYFPPVEWASCLIKQLLPTHLCYGLYLFGMTFSSFPKQRLEVIRRKSSQRNRIRASSLESFFTNAFYLHPSHTVWVDMAPAFCKKKKCHLQNAWTQCISSLSNYVMSINSFPFLCILHTNHISPHLYSSHSLTFSLIPPYPLFSPP